MQNKRSINTSIYSLKLLTLIHKSFSDEKNWKSYVDLDGKFASGSDDNGLRTLALVEFRGDTSLEQSVDDPRRHNI
jgi:hypothetical protein